jgi:hypothetical protein
MLKALSHLAFLCYELLCFLGVFKRSPTPTAFSGISNYRNDSYRPIRDKNVPAVSTIDYCIVSHTHFDELSRYLAAYLAKSAFCLSIDKVWTHPQSSLLPYTSSQFSLDSQTKTH